MTTTYHAFLGCSLDGFIAGPNNELDWLTEFEGTGFEEFFGTIDAMAMGRSTFEVMQGMDPTFYRGMPIHVLSKTLPSGPAEPLGASPVTIHSSIDALREALTRSGARRVYVDGGKVVQSFLAAGLLSDLTMTQVPVLIGAGIPLFDSTPKHLRARLLRSITTHEGAVQSVYGFETEGR